MTEQKPAYVAADTAELQRRVLCADGVPHYRFGQDVSTFRNLAVACEWADEFSSMRRGQMCGPHSIGVPAHVGT